MKNTDPLKQPWNGKDGKVYDSWYEANEANARYEQHLEQKALLEEQNKLIAKQIEMNAKLEQERLQKEYENRIQQQEHDEKMRILKIFDDIGISKKTFDEYLNRTFFTDGHVSISDNINRNLDYLGKLEILLNACISDDFKYYQMAKNEDIRLLKREISSDCYVIDEEKEKEIREKLEQLKKDNKKLLLYNICYAIAILIISGIGIESGIDFLPYSALLIWPIVPIYSGVVYKKRDDKKRYYRSLEKKPTLDEEKYIKKLESLIEVTKKEIEKDKKKTSTSMKKAVEDLNKFRYNHYNSNIEKLLIDVGLDTIILNLGLEYPKINNNNKIKDGTIEDYIAYFDSYDTKEIERLKKSK